MPYSNDSSTVIKLSLKMSQISQEVPEILKYNIIFATDLRMFKVWYRPIQLYILGVVYGGSMEVFPTLT